MPAWQEAGVLLCLNAQTGGTCGLTEKGKSFMLLALCEGHEVTYHVDC